RRIAADAAEVEQQDEEGRAQRAPEAREERHLPEADQVHPIGERPHGHQLEDEEQPESLVHSSSFPATGTQSRGSRSAWPRTSRMREGSSRASPRATSVTRVRLSGARVKLRVNSMEADWTAIVADSLPVRCWLFTA